MRVEKLKIALQEKILVDIAFTIERSLALVGQSGSGKSLTLKALLGMLPRQMELELEIQSDFALVRGETVAFVPQNPFTALSPLTRIREQMFVPPRRMRELFALVGLDEALLERFAPELSGGQLQRVVIAVAVATNPKLLLLDEPTTALDVRTGEHILALLKRLQKEMGYKMLFVTHDIPSAQSLCEDICVIKEGIIQSSGKIEQLLHTDDAYTKRLVESSFRMRSFRQ